MGDIGKPIRHIEIEEPNPETAPIKEPSPVTVPVPAKEPVHA
jgi:hypothetical protein